MVSINGNFGIFDNGRHLQQSNFEQKAQPIEIPIGKSKPVGNESVGFYPGVQFNESPKVNTELSNNTFKGLNGESPFIKTLNDLSGIYS